MTCLALHLGVTRAGSRSSASDDQVCETGGAGWPRRPRPQTPADQWPCLAPRIRTAEPARVLCPAFWTRHGRCAGLRLHAAPTHHPGRPSRLAPPPARGAGSGFGQPRITPALCAGFDALGHARQDALPGHNGRESRRDRDPIHYLSPGSSPAGRGSGMRPGAGTPSVNPSVFYNHWNGNVHRLMGHVSRPATARPVALCRQRGLPGR